MDPSRLESTSRPNGDAGVVKEITPVVNANYSTSALLFDFKSAHLHRVDFDNESASTKKLEKFPDGLPHIAAVALGGCIYIFRREPCFLYKIDYCKASGATWQRMCKWRIEDHGWVPRAAASPGAIFLVGGGEETPLKSVSKYDILPNQWKQLKSKPTSSKWSTLLCADEFLYCIGGYDEMGNPTNTVERMNLRSGKWSAIAGTPVEKVFDCAAEYKGKIYVFYDDEIKKTWYVASLDPIVNQWTEFRVIDHSYESARIEMKLWWSAKSLVIDGNLYLVSGTGISKYDVEKDELSDVMPFTDMDVRGAVLVKMLM